MNFWLHGTNMYWRKENTRRTFVFCMTTQCWRFYWTRSSLDFFVAHLLLFRTRSWKTRVKCLSLYFYVLSLGNTIWTEVSSMEKLLAKMNILTQGFQAQLKRFFNGLPTMCNMNQYPTSTNNLKFLYRNMYLLHTSKLDQNIYDSWYNHLSANW